LPGADFVGADSVAEEEAGAGLDSAAAPRMRCRRWSGNAFDEADEIHGGHVLILSVILGVMTRNPSRDGV